MFNNFFNSQGGQGIYTQPIQINTGNMPVARSVTPVSVSTGLFGKLSNGLGNVGDFTKNLLLGKQATLYNGNVANSNINPRVAEYQEYLRQNGYDEDTVNGVAQGLNNGNSDISDWINQYNNSADGKLNPINIPQTEEEINLARQGLYNSPSLQGSVGVAPRQGGLIRDFQTGFKDNYNNSFDVNNWGQGQKSLAQRLGEGAGTVIRFADSPLGRGLIAAGLNSALGYDNSLQEGLQAAVLTQQNKTDDALYRNALAQQGIDLSNIPNGYVGKETYKNLALNTYRTQKLNIQQEIANAKDNTSRARMILNAYNNNALNEEEAINELQKYGINVTDLETPNKTRLANVRENESSAKIANLKSSTAYKDWLRSGGNKKKPVDKTANNADLAEFQEILAGGDANKIQYARNSYIKKYGKDPQKLIARDY